MSDNKRQWEKLFLVVFIWQLRMMSVTESDVMRAVCFGIAFASAYGFIFCDDKFTEDVSEEAGNE